VGTPGLNVSVSVGGRLGAVVVDVTEEGDVEVVELWGVMGSVGASHPA
jgi:hypothetical protein